MTPPITLSSIGTEALDNPAADPALVAHIVRDIARSNRWLGGASAVRLGLAHLLRPSDRGRTLTLFDIGTGAADLPLDAQRWARRRGITLTPLGLDRIPTAARVAHDAGVPVVVACASALPIAPRSVDIVLISQVAHHLDAASAARLFVAATTIARRGVIVADLRPAWFAALGFRCAGRVLGFHRVTIDDGVTSLRRGYTVEQLRALCRGAVMADVEVVAARFARVVGWWGSEPGARAPD